MANKLANHFSLITLSKMSKIYDPTKASHFDIFQTAPSKEKKRQFDFRLSPEELQTFQTQGFVVSRAKAAASFADAYYRTYSDHLPVMVTSDSLLHAFHKTYDSLLRELETTVMSQRLEQIWNVIRSRIQPLMDQYCGTELEPCIKFLDVYSTVGLVLLKTGCVLEESDDDDELMSFMRRRRKPEPQTVINCIFPENEQEVSDVTARLISACANSTVKFRGLDIDCSIFQPRSHYVASVGLRRYFKSHMWAGHVEFEVTGNRASPLWVGAAVLLALILQKSDSLKSMCAIESSLAGVTDGFCIDNFAEVLETMGVTGPDAIASAEAITNLMHKLEQLEGDVGRPKINGHMRASDPSTPASVVLPRVVTLLGQKLALDSLVFSMLCFDRLKAEDGCKIVRKVPSCLDIATVVFRNASAKPFVDDLMKTTGLDYSYGLAQCLANPHLILSSNSGLYFAWLKMLKTLSQPGSLTPLGSEAWAQRLMNTQLASWTELRHDNVLYVKQGASFMTCCGYPDGFVEPIPAFWEAFRVLVQELNKIIPHPILNHWDSVLTNLHDISLAEVKGQGLSEDQTKFLKRVMEERFGSGGSKFCGWYPRLFHSAAKDSAKPVHCVIDVHTNHPDPNTGDPGCILYQAVDPAVSMMLVTFPMPDGSSACYAGPVYCHYEFTQPVEMPRLTDKAWLKMCSVQKMNHVPWSKGWMVDTTPQPAPESWLARNDWE